MNWMDLVQIVLLLLACVACYFKGLGQGVQDALDFCVREKLVDEDLLHTKMKRIAEDDE